jgi:outer membrane protein TolC
MKPLLHKSFIILLIFLGNNVFAQDILTLDSAIAIALENNYGIKISKNELEIASNNAVKANAGYWPTVTFDGGGTVRFDNLQNQKFSNGSEFNNTNVNSRALNASVNLNWTIFDGKKMFATYERLQELQAIGEINLKESVQNAVYDVMLTYYDIVRLKLQLKALEQNMSVSAERLNLEKMRAQLGKGTQLLVTQADLDYKTQTTTKVQQENAITNAKVRLNQLLARKIDVIFDVTDSIPLNCYPEFEVYKAQAIASNSQLQILRKNIIIQEKILKEQAAEKLPTIGINAGYGYNQSANSAGFSQSSNNLGLNGGLSIRWNLFDGGRVKRNLNNTKIAIENQKLSLDQSTIEMESAILQACNDLTNAKDVARLEEENFTLAQQSIAIIQERFKMGVANTLELKDAQNVFDNATIRRSVALYQAKVAEINLLFLTSRLGSVQ